MYQVSKSTEACCSVEEEEKLAVGTNIEINPSDSASTQNGSNNHSYINETQKCKNCVVVLQKNPTTVRSETIELSCVNNVNNELKISDDNSTCMASSDNYVIDVEPNKDVSDADIKSDKIINDDCKVDKVMENENSLVSTGKNKLCQDKCNMECGNIKMMGEVTENITAPSNNREFPDANKNCENFQNTNSISVECDKRTVIQDNNTNDSASDGTNAENGKRASSQDSKTDNRIADTTTKKETLIGGDEKLVVDKPLERGKDSICCKDFNNENIEHTKVTNDKNQSDEHAESIINDGQSSGREKENSNFIDGEDTNSAQDGINNVIKGQEELSPNEIEKMEISHDAKSNTIARDGANDGIEKQTEKELSYNTIELMETIVVTKLNESYKNASDTAGETNTSNKSASSQDNEINRVTGTVINEESLVGGGDTKLIINDKCLDGDKDSLLIKDFEHCKGMNNKKPSMEQDLQNNESAELVSDDRQSPDREKVNSNSTGAAQDSINDVTEKQDGKEESSFNEMETSVVTEDSNKQCNNGSEIGKTSQQLVRKRGRRSSKSTSGFASPPLSSTPKSGRARWRSGGNFEVTKEHLVPFKLGWLREVVERATCASPNRMWDIYYRSPDGTKKLRSMPDIINYLKLHPESGLTHKNFTFFKTHIYREPFELTRKAKARPNNLTPSPKSPKQENKSKSKSPSSSKEQAKPKIVCDEPPLKKLKLSRCKNESVTEENPVVQDEPAKKKAKPNNCKNESIIEDKSSSKAQKAKSNKHVPLILSRRSNRVRNVNAAISPTKTPNIYEKVYTNLTKPSNDYSRPLHKLCRQLSVSVQNEIQTTKKDIKNKSTDSKNALASHLNEKLNKITIKLNREHLNLNKKTSKSLNEELSAIDVNLCSNRCPGTAGEIPSLQCIVCLCLFHPMCMGLNKAATNFICKRCNATKPSTKKSQDELHKNKDKAVELNTQSSLSDSLERSDSESTDEDSATNVSVLTPEVVIQHEGFDQDEEIMPTPLSYSYPQASVGAINTVTAPSQYQQVVLSNKTNFIRPVPPLTPFAALTPPLQTSHQLLSSKRVAASSTYFPPSFSDTAAAIRVSANKTSNTYHSASFTSCNMPTFTSSKPNIYSPLIGNPPVCFASPPRLINTLKPPPLGIPHPNKMQNPINTGPPPLRLVAPTSIATGVGNCNRIVLSNNAGSCLVLAPQTGLASGSATQLIGPFSPGSQIMVVNNKVICVNPISNKQLSEQRSSSVISSVTSSDPSVCPSHDVALEPKATCIKMEQNNPYLAALLNKPNTPLTGNQENSASIKNTDVRVTNIPLSSSSVPTSSVIVIDGKASTVPSKLTAVIPPSFPVSKSSILKCSITTTGSCLLPTFSFVSGSSTSLESPYKKSSYTQESNLAKHIEERFKLHISTAPTVVLSDTSSSVLLNTNINKRMETSTTPAIKSPMTTARLLKGTESSLSFPEVKAKSSENSNSESNKNDVKLILPASSPLNVENQISESLEDSVSLGAKQNNLLEEHTCSLRSNSIRDQPFRTAAFTPTFTTAMNTMTSCYNCLNNIFQYLSITDLLRVKLVCKCWYRLASQQFLWRKISLRNIIIADWRKFATAIDLHGTTYLDLQGHILFHDTWQNFVSVLNRLDKIQHVECGLIPAFVLYAMASKLVHLKSLTGECAMFSHWTTGRVGPCVINFNLLENLKEMEKFRLRCKEGLMATVMGGLLPISHLTKLKHLSLTTLEGVDAEQFKFLNKLNNLETLEIGECTTWTRKIYDSIGKMTNLHMLRLEKGGEVDGLVEALSNLLRLKELHLVAYKIPPSLGTALHKLEMLKTLSLWPDTSSNGPFQNCKALHAVNGLIHLKELRWVILSNNCDISEKATVDDQNCWREQLEDYKECQINFSDPSSDIPLVPLAELNTTVKARSWKNAPRCITINGLRESLQDALPLTEIKMFQVPMQQLRKYSAFR